MAGYILPLPKNCIIMQINLACTVNALLRQVISHCSYGMKWGI